MYCLWWRHVGLFLTCNSSNDTVLLIDEVAWVAEEFLGSYTVEEHGKRENVVRSPHVNWECSERGVRLFKREELNEERRKEKRSRPADDELPEPIPTMPMWAVAPGASASDFGVGCPASSGSRGMAARVEDGAPPAK